MLIKIKLFMYITKELKILIVITLRNDKYEYVKNCLELNSSKLKHGTNNQGF